MSLFGPKDVKADPTSELYVVYDIKGGYYHQPMFVKNRYDLFRDYERMCRDPEHSQKTDIVTNAEDFQVFKIASWFAKDGRLEVSRPEHVANLHEIKSAVMQRIQNQGQPSVGPVGI